MKTTFTRIFTLLGCSLAVGLATVQETQAQDFGVLIKAHPDDAETLLGNYIEPAFSGFGYGIANGWYNTGAPHKFPGFDLTVSLSMVTVPAEGQSFSFNASDYNGRVSTTSSELPTLFGSSEVDHELRYQYTREFQNETYIVDETVEFPGGIGFPFVPVPIAQIGIGLPKNTDVKIRYIPSVAVGDLTLGLWGVGVMHDFKQWIPGIKTLPFDASVFVGYTKFEAINDFGANPDNADFTTDGEGIISSSALTYQLLISKKLSVLTVYAGVGANSINSNLQMLGTYYVEAENENSGAVEQIELGTDPIDLQFTTGGARATIGARLKLAIITFHADYTVQKYNTLNAGIGFSVR